MKKHEIYSFKQDNNNEHSETDYSSKGDNYICTFIFSQRALCIIYKLCGEMILFNTMTVPIITNRCKQQNQSWK